MGLRVKNTFIDACPHIDDEFPKAAARSSSQPPLSRPSEDTVCSESASRVASPSQEKRGLELMHMPPRVPCDFFANDDIDSCLDKLPTRALNSLGFADEESMPASTDAGGECTASCPTDTSDSFGTPDSSPVWASPTAPTSAGDMSPFTLNLAEELDVPSLPERRKRRRGPRRAPPASRLAPAAAAQESAALTMNEKLDQVLELVQFLEKNLVKPREVYLSRGLGWRHDSRWSKEELKAVCLEHPDLEVSDEDKSFYVLTASGHGVAFVEPKDVKATDYADERVSQLREWAAEHEDFFEKRKLGAFDLAQLLFQEQPAFAESLTLGELHGLICLALKPENKILQYKKHGGQSIVMPWAASDAGQRELERAKEQKLSPEEQMERLQRDRNAIKVVLERHARGSGKEAEKADKGSFIWLHKVKELVFEECHYHLNEQDHGKLKLADLLGSPEFSDICALNYDGANSVKLLPASAALRVSHDCGDVV